MGSEGSLFVSLKNAPADAALHMLSEIDGVRSVEKLEDGTDDSLTALKLTCRGETDLREAVYGTVKQTDWVLMEFRQETKTLETIFRELTKEN
jgi:hypothetical protein